MYAIKACEDWRYGSKTRVSGYDVGLALWHRVVGRVDSGILKDYDAFIVTVARSEQSHKTESSAAPLWENS